MSILGNESLLTEGIVVSVTNNDRDGTVVVIVRQDHDFPGKSLPHIALTFGFVDEASLSGRIRSGMSEIRNVVGSARVHDGAVTPYYTWSITIDDLDIKFTSSSQSMELNVLY